MNGFRTSVAAIVIPLVAIVITLIGIEQIQAGGDGVSNGIRALIGAGVFWVLAIVAVRRFFKAAGAVADSLAADTNRSVTRNPDDPPERLM